MLAQDTRRIQSLGPCVGGQWRHIVRDQVVRPVTPGCTPLSTIGFLLQRGLSSCTGPVALVSVLSSLLLVSAGCCCPWLKSKRRRALHPWGTGNPSGPISSPLLASRSSEYVSGPRPDLFIWQACWAPPVRSSLFAVVPDPPPSIRSMTAVRISPAPLSGFVWSNVLKFPVYVDAGSPSANLVESFRRPSIVGPSSCFVSVSQKCSALSVSLLSLPIEPELRWLGY